MNTNSSHPLSSYDKAKALVDQFTDLDLRREAERSLAPTDNLTRQVTVFHKLYEMPIIQPSKACQDFSHISKERLAMRFGLIAEEFMELCSAMDMRADIHFLYQDEEGVWCEGVRSEIGNILVIERPDQDGLTEDDTHDIMRQRLQHAVCETDERDMVEVSDACGDLKYVIAGFELEVGIPGPQVLAEIQASNLSKLGADGLPIYREDGKVMKGPSYFKANIFNVLKAYGMRLTNSQRI